MKQDYKKLLQISKISGFYKFRNNKSEKTKVQSIDLWMISLIKNFNKRSIERGKPCLL